MKEVLIKFTEVPNPETLLDFVKQDERIPKYVAESLYYNPTIGNISSHLASVKPHYDLAHNVFGVEWIA